MEKNRLTEIIRRKLNLEDGDWSVIEKSPKVQKLFQNAIEASQKELIKKMGFI